MIVDYRKRADRRKLFYERIVSLALEFFCRRFFVEQIFFRNFQRADPTQFLQLHGRKSKINFENSDLTDESQYM